MIPLRKSTASQEVLLGPFLDDTDGKTAETALSIANTDIKLWKRGGTTESSKNSGGVTHIASGRYYAVLDATDTDTTGELILNVAVAGRSSGLCAMFTRRRYSMRCLHLLPGIKCLSGRVPRRRSILAGRQSRRSRMRLRFRVPPASISRAISRAI